MLPAWKQTRKAAGKARRQVEYFASKKLKVRPPKLKKRPAAAKAVAKTIHKGRHLVLRLRSISGTNQSKRYAVLPLPPKVAGQGHAAGAESFLETALKIQTKLRPGHHVAGVDGAKSLHAAAKHCSVPAIPNVSHMRFVFTPLGAVPKKGLDATATALFRKLCADQVCAERRSAFILAAGDQAAESVAAVSKTQLRRMNLLSATARDEIEHRNVLAAHFLNKHPGMDAVLGALALFRSKASKGLACPSACFKQPLWKC